MTDLRDDQYRPINDDLIGWAIWRPDDEAEYFLTGIDQEQAAFGAMLLNEDAVGDVWSIPAADAGAILRDAIAYVQCTDCGRTAFAAQVDSTGRALECQS